MTTTTTTKGGRDGEVTFEMELSYNYSYFQVMNLGTLVTLVVISSCHYKDLAEEVT